MILHPTKVELLSADGQTFDLTDKIAGPIELTLSDGRKATWSGPVEGVYDYPERRAFSIPLQLTQPRGVPTLWDVLTARPSPRRHFNHGRKLRRRTR